MPDNDELADVTPLRRMLQTPAGVQGIDELDPQTPDEERAAAGAVERRRRERAAEDLVERLGTFELELARRAFAAGARAQADRLAAAIGTASSTVDGDTLRRLNSAYPSGPALPDVASQALRFAEASHEAPAALRLADVRRVLRELEELLRAFHIAEDVGEAEDVGAELELVDRLRGTIDALELGIGRVGAAVDGDLEEPPA